MPNFGRSQGRSQPRRCRAAPASGRWARGWVRTNVSHSTAGIRGSRPPDFFVYFKYKILHSDAFFGSKNEQYQCFYQGPMHWGKETVGRGCRMRPEGPKIEAEIGVGFLRKVSKPDQLGGLAVM